MRQKDVKKNVEHAFGLLQLRFPIVVGLTCFWKKDILHDIMTVCIIIHNMITKDDRDVDAPI